MIRQESAKLAGAEKLKALDIADIYDNYDRLCRSLNVKEIGDIYNDLNNLSPAEFSNCFRTQYPLVSLMVIDGFDEFTTPEIEFINSTADITGLELYVQLDYYGLNEHIFSHLDQCYSKLLSKKFLITEDENEDRSQEFRKIIRTQMFVPGGIKAVTGNISVIESPSREMEIEFIAKEIKDLLFSGNVEPANICVVFNLIKNYSPLVRDIFPVYGLPFNLTDRKALAMSSPVVTIINFLEILENDYYYKNIFRSLSSGYIKLNNINLSNLYAASANLKIISGYSNWINSLQEGIINLEAENGRSSAGKVYIYKKALEDIKLLNDFLTPFNSKMTVREFRNLLIKTIYDLNIHGEILNKNADNVEENIKGLTEFIGTLDELFELLEKEEGNAQLPLKYFLNNIRTAVTGTRFNIKEKPGYGILVTNLNEIRGLSFDYLFIGGLCDGDFPTRYKPEIFNSGTYVKNEKRHQTEERYHFYQALCSWNKNLFLSYPLFSDKKELVKSNILREFEELFETETKNAGDYKSKIYSNEELLNTIGSKKLKLSADNAYKLNSLRIKESIDINNLRKENPFGSSEYTGRILSKLDLVSRQALDSHCKKEFSVSQLELYAGCPFRYFVERVLTLNTIEEPVEEIEAKELGSLLHVILYRFYTELNEKGIKLKNADDDCFNIAVELMFSIAENEIKAAVFSPLSFYEKEKILGINGRKTDSILYQFLLLERASGDNYVPSFFEVSFGDLPREKYDKGESLSKFKAGNISVRGKIDRVDIDYTEEKFKVIDYKSGTFKPSEKDIQAGLSLQLPLYMIAARELIRLRLAKDFIPAGGEIYSLKYSEKDLKKSTVIKESPEMADNCIQMIEKYVDSIAGGNFNLSELEDREKRICRFCTYRTVCRIDELN